MTRRRPADPGPLWRPRWVRPLWDWLAPHRLRVALSMGLGCLASVFEVASLGLLMVLLSVSDQGLPERLGPFSRVVPLLRGLPADGQRAVLVALILAGIAVRGVAWWWSAALRERVGAAVGARARRLAFERVARAPLAFLEARSSGDHDTLILRETERLTRAATGFVQLGVVSAMALCYLALLFYMAPGLTLAALGFLGLTVLTIRLLRRPVERYAHRMREASRPLAAAVHETLASLRLLQAVGRSDAAVERFDASNRAFLDAQRRQREALDAIPPASELCGAVVVLGILWLGSTFIPLRGGGGPAPLLTYVFTFYRLLPRFLALPSTRAALAADLSSVGVLDAFLKDPAATPLPDGGQAPGPGPHTLSLEAVSFSYAPGGPPAIEALDLVLAPGRTVALIGPSGAGKSTVVDLVLGLRRPTTGRVRLDGTDLAVFAGDRWRRRVGVVSQDTRLFHRSVRENLRLVDPDADDARLWAALETAAAADVVRRLPDGLDHVLGEQGARLSGGERQRLAIARALVADPELLVFDEPTAHLDADSERAVTEALARAAASRAVLLIAHRLATVRGADEIVLLHRGRVVERGDHATLLARDGAYARLVRQGRDDLSAAPASSDEPTARDDARPGA